MRVRLNPAFAGHSLFRLRNAYRNLRQLAPAHHPLQIVMQRPECPTDWKQRSTTSGSMSCSSTRNATGCAFGGMTTGCDLLRLVRERSSVASAINPHPVSPHWRRNSPRDAGSPGFPVHYRIATGGAISPPATLQRCTIGMSLSSTDPPVWPAWCNPPPKGAPHVAACRAPCNHSPNRANTHLFLSVPVNFSA